jgi:outer membrane protein assembly factor BamB
MRDSGLAEPAETQSAESKSPQPAQSPTITPDAASASEWSRWRGTTGQGTLPPAALPQDLPPTTFPIAWSQPLGTGWSSPVVARQIVVITDRQGEQERILAFALGDGRPLWAQTRPVDFDPHPVGRRHGNGPKSTPAIDNGRVYNMGISGWLSCCDLATGEMFWQIDLPNTYGRHQPLSRPGSFVNGTTNVIVPIDDGVGAPVPLFGYTGSPVIVDDMLVTMVGGERGGTVMAFDKKTGDEIWRALNENVSYSSPIVATVADRQQVIVMTGPRVVGLDATNGALLWSHPFQIQFDESISTPVTSGDLVLVTGSGRPLTALRIERNDDGRNGDGFTSSVAWTNEDLSSYLSSMVVLHAHVYGMNDGGELVCASLADGKTVWFKGSHGFYSTPILAGERMLALNEQGTLRQFTAAPTGYDLGATWQLTDEATWSVPAMAERKALVRSAKSLTCYSLSP